MHLSEPAPSKRKETFHETGGSGAAAPAPSSTGDKPTTDEFGRVPTNLLT
ncbi:hypothetical protein ACFIOY_29700 [Bradyrhizobium sp. TZ2]